MSGVQVSPLRPEKPLIYEVSIICYGFNVEKLFHEDDGKTLLTRSLIGSYLIKWLSTLDKSINLKLDYRVGMKMAE